MISANKIVSSIALLLIIFVLLGGGCLLGVYVGTGLHKENMDAEINNITNCPCHDHCDCDHGFCECGDCNENCCDCDHEHQGARASLFSGNTGISSNYIQGYHSLMGTFWIYVVYDANLIESVELLGSLVENGSAFEWSMNGDAYSPQVLFGINPKPGYKVNDVPAQYRFKSLFSRNVTDAEQFVGGDYSHIDDWTPATNYCLSNGFQVIQSQWFEYLRESSNVCADLFRLIDLYDVMCSQYVFVVDLRDNTDYYGAPIVVPIGGNTYYRNGNSFFTVNSATQHYHCTNSQHTGTNDYTTNPIPGTCYTTTDRASWTQAYYGHVCSEVYGNHTSTWVTCPSCGGSGKLNYSSGGGWLHDVVEWDGCTTCGGSGHENTGIWGHSSGTSGHGGWYQCDYCGTRNYSGIDTNQQCASHITGYKCSYCNRTFSSNTTSSCYSRSWKKCVVCSGNWDSCSCTQQNNHEHTTQSYYMLYSYHNIDTGANITSQTPYNMATGYNVVFNINNSNAVINTGTTGGSMANQYMLHDHSEALTANGFTFSGHYLAGWATSPGTSANPASVVYTNGQVINLSTSNVASGGTLNLYGVWLYVVAKPVASGGTSYTYNDGATITHSVNNYNTSYMTRSGTASANVVGHYSVTYALKTGYCWNTGANLAERTGNAVLNWTITKKSLTKPTLAANPTYTGSTVSPTLNNFDSGKMTQSGTTSAINVNTGGTYTMTITLKDTNNYQWSGGGSVTISWNVLPQNISGATVTIPQTDYIYDGSAKQPDPTVTV